MEPPFTSGQCSASSILHTSEPMRGRNWGNRPRTRPNGSAPNGFIQEREV